MTGGSALEIVAAGPLATLQDAGRQGLRRLGIPRAGTLVEPWRRIANALVGNAAGAPVIEAFEAGLQVQAVGGAVRLAAVGDARLLRTGTDGRQSQPAANGSITLNEGERLSIRSSGRARAVIVAISGVAIAAQHGSVSTYVRARLGGIDGRALAVGDRLPVDRRPEGAEQRVPATALVRCLALGGAIDDRVRVVRAVPGPQETLFASGELERFFGNAGWRVAAETDRMGCRLDGEALRHRTPADADIVSDAILPGVVQVPGAGLPIAMLADAHTAGGYPKIATIVQADLPLLALARPGTTIRFARIDAAAGVDAARCADRALARLLSELERFATRPDSARLLAANLIDGAVDALGGSIPP